jgi:peptidoglycan/LPS O-acetylase OafA/YrhL
LLSALMSGPGLFNFHVARVPALDGVRGIAILLVFAAHTNPVLLSGGKIGVDLFFVLSGFLITSILLQEFRERGTIHLGYFYARRALRLLPALFSVIAFVVIFTWITRPSNLAITIWNAFGAMFYFYNWQIVVAPYPEYLSGRWMFTHFWSLSIEEQFYTTWPLLVLLMLGLRVPLRIRFLIVAAGIVLPEIARLVVLSRDPSLHSVYMVYFRTDLHMDGLMWGALAAMLIEARLIPTGPLRKIIAWGAPLALAGLIAIASQNWLPDGRFGRFGVSLVGLLSAVLIYAAACCPLPFFNAALEYRPLRWIGMVSYGLYLWHWPLIRAAEDTHWGPLSQTILAFGATFAISAFSFYWYEKPFLRLKDRFIAGSRRQLSETGMTSIVAKMREAGASGDAVTATVKPAADPRISSW